MMALRKANMFAVVAVLAASASCLVPGASPAWAQSDDELKAGQELVEVNCGKCHGVGTADASPYDGAPPFRKLSDSFPMDALEEAFSDGRIYSGHPDMPEFIATPEQVDAIIAYIASLQDLARVPQASKTIRKLAFWSIPLAFGVMGLKFVAWYVTGSIALYSDALESIVNVIAALAAFVAIGYAQKPADTGHPYGHHKAEYFSAVLEGVLIVIAASLIVNEAIGGLLEPQRIDALGAGACDQCGRSGHQWCLGGNPVADWPPSQVACAAG